MIANILFPNKSIASVILIFVIVIALIVRFLRKIPFMMWGGLFLALVAFIAEVRVGVLDPVLMQVNLDRQGAIDLGLHGAAGFILLLVAIPLILSAIGGIKFLYQLIKLLIQLKWMGCGLMGGFFICFLLTIAIAKEWTPVVLLGYGILLFWMNQRSKSE